MQTVYEDSYQSTPKMKKEKSTLRKNSPVSSESSEFERESMHLIDLRDGRDILRAMKVRE